VDDVQKGSLEALAMDGGATLWSAEGFIIYSPPALSNGRIYFGAQDGKFYALSCQDGHMIWSFDAGGVATSPVVFGNIIYFSTTNGKIYALSEDTGELRWVKTQASQFSAPTVTNEAVFVGGDELAALDPLTGQLKWSFNGRWGNSTPAVKDNKVFVSCGYRLYCLDLESAKVIWSAFTGNEYGASIVPSVSENTLFWGTVTAFDPNTGKVKWAFDSKNQIYTASVAAANGYVFVGSARQSMLMDSSDGRLYVLKEDSGEVVWQYLAGIKSNDRYFADPSPSIAERSVVLSLSMNQLCCFTTAGNSPISAILASKASFNPYDLTNGNIELHFSLNTPATVSVDVLDYKGELARRLIDNQPFDKGEHGVAWYGLVDFPEMADPNLQAELGDKCVLVAPDGDYKLLLTARGADGKSYTAEAGVKVESGV
jgi:outer membrane protein assembly factor BamB